MKQNINYVKTLPENIGGKCIYPKFPFFGVGTCQILILEKYKDDKGILNHELKHENQYKKDWCHAFKTKCSRKYRLEIELEAYEEQIKQYGYSNIKQCDWIVDALMDKYNLGYARVYIIERIKIIFENRIGI